MDAYKKQLRRLALAETNLGEDRVVQLGALPVPGIDERTAALVRLAATVAVGATAVAFRGIVEHALATGIGKKELVLVLEAVAPVVGAARVVGCASKLALALGYDIDEALELP